MKKILYIISLLATSSVTNHLQAQVLTVSPGTNMTIRQGTVFFADSLIITPSADFTVSNVTLTRSTTVNHPLLKPYIARVYQFSNTTDPFRGSIQINYRDGAELKGISEANLSLNVHNGTVWNAYPPNARDAAKNFVLTGGLNAVTLDELTLAGICPPPVIQCTGNITRNATAGKCGATVSYSPPVVTDACENTTVQQTEGLPSGSFFPVGITTNTFVVTSLSGQKDTCSFTVTVLDKDAPVITQVSASPASLWPANHKMQNVSVNYNTWDNCGSVSSSLSVSSNEPVTGIDDATSPDWLIVDNHHLQLRAERSGRGNGRVYTITITSTDASGNSSTQTTQVVVPHNSNPKMNYVDQLFECKVIPNPSSQYFELQVNSGSNEKIEVNLYDINGKFLSKMNAAKNQSLRFGSNLRPGTYMVEVIQGQQHQRIYVIKQ